jgi:hypothetical protein
LAFLDTQPAPRRPPAAVAARLLRVHAQACHLAETKHEIVSARDTGL